MSSSSSKTSSNKSSNTLSVLAEVASRRRRQRRAEGESHYVTLTFLMPDADRVVHAVVRAVGGRFSGADVYRAAVDASPYEFPLHMFSDSLRVYHNHNVLVLPVHLFRADRDREFYASPSMGATPHWHVRHGWVPA